MHAILRCLAVSVLNGNLLNVYCPVVSWLYLAALLGEAATLTKFCELFDGQLDIIV